MATSIPKAWRSISRTATSSPAAFYNILEERSAAGREHAWSAAQVGWKPVIGTGRLTLGASLFDFNSVQHRNPFYRLPAGNGNTTTTVAAIAWRQRPAW